MEIIQTIHCADRSPLVTPNSPVLSSSPQSHNALLPSSSFLRLSPELRNQIYQHLYMSSIIKVGTDTPGLPLTCKQLYADCTDMFYASTAFYVEDCETLLRWLKHLSPYRRNLIMEIWCGPDMALPDDPMGNVTCHGVLRRMARRLESLGLYLGGQDVLRAGVQIDERFNVWSSDPVLVWLVVERAFCEWACRRNVLELRELPAADVIRMRVMERLHELSEGHSQHTIAPEMTTREDRLRYRFLRL